MTLYERLERARREIATMIWFEYPDGTRVSLIETVEVRPTYIPPYGGWDGNMLLWRTGNPEQTITEVKTMVGDNGNIFFRLTVE